MTTKVLSRSATLFDSGGFVVESGLTVLDLSGGDLIAPCITVGGTPHLRDDLEIAGASIAARDGGWSVDL